ncbi:protein PIN-LIKES 6 [Iris pallida]|uniref:Protein PIN-LIKES 6 n=1 Tax=Iris pallida TaxID=29817 RepID=A0AAX6EQK8_IRIPA|nr:protein PIN-LIKES 6 [Iris pallida]
MEWSLLSKIIEDQGSGGRSFLSTAKFAVLPIAKVFTMCFMGYLMASKHVNILPTNGRKLLNGLVFSLLLPCLIFSQLGRAITFEKLLQWWFIPANVVLGSISGSLIGFIVASVISPPYPYFKFTVIHIGIGNIGNIPLVLIAALCRDVSNPFGNSENVAKMGMLIYRLVSGLVQSFCTLMCFRCLLLPRVKPLMALKGIDFQLEHKLLWCCSS